MTNQEFRSCAYCGQKGTEMHHLFKRSTNPELKDEKKNLVLLCHSCHSRTENDQSFLKALQDIFFSWNPHNLNLFLRAKASLESLENGQEIEFLTPAMSSYFLSLAGAGYAFYSEQLVELDIKEAQFWIQESDETDKKRMMLWRNTELGQEQLRLKSKLKILEKEQSNLRAILRRMEIEKRNLY